MARLQACRDSIVLFEMDHVRILQDNTRGQLSRVYQCTIRGHPKVVKCIVQNTREAQMLSVCRGIHGVVHLHVWYHHTVLDGQLWSVILVMPLYPEGDVFGKLCLIDFTSPWAECGMSLTELLNVFLPSVADTLQVLHSIGLAHLDIKPENILMDSETTPTQYILTDFGHCRYIEDRDQPSRTTPLYQAPEIGTNTPSPKKSDVYSLGRTALVLLFCTTELAVLYNRGGTVNWTRFYHWKRVPRWGQILLDGMLERDPRRRLSIDEVCKKLHSRKWNSNCWCW
jgi:serine/threonine protein kinase